MAARSYTFLSGIAHYGKDRNGSCPIFKRGVVCLMPTQVWERLSLCGVLFSPAGTVLFTLETVGLCGVGGVFWTRRG